MLDKNKLYIAFYARFTLLEVVIATAIMAMGMMAILEITARSKDRVIHSETRWAKTHQLNLAVEYFLLAGASSDLPDGLIIKSLSAECELELVEEDLPDFAIEPQNAWVLARYNIKLFNRAGELMASQLIEKVVREDDI